MKRFFDRFYSKTGMIKDVSQRNVASRVSALAVEGTILFSLMGTFGVDTSPLIAAAGVTGATIGFACKDFGANFVASIALSGQKSLRTGNKVTVGTSTNAVSGVVIDWDTRYLYLRNSKEEIVSVPNNVVLNSVVTWENPGTQSPTSSDGASSGPHATAKDYDPAKDGKEWKAASSVAEPPSSKK